MAIVEDWSGGADGTFRLMRFQVQDHLNSVSAELDEAGMLLSYEEYMPFGSTAYQLPSSKAPKRFRFASKERDMENDFYYFGQRYYMPWHSRLVNPDPIGIGDGLNVYEYVKSNLMRHMDPHDTCRQKATGKRSTDDAPRGDTEHEHRSSRWRRDLETPPRTFSQTPSPPRRPVATPNPESFKIAIQAAAAHMGDEYRDEFVAIGGLAVKLHGCREQIGDVDVAATPRAW